MCSGDDIRPTNRSGESASVEHSCIMQHIADMSRAGGNGSGESACVEHICEGRCLGAGISEYITEIIQSNLPRGGGNIQARSHCHLSDRRGINSTQTAKAK